MEEKTTLELNVAKLKNELASAIQKAVRGDITMDDLYSIGQDLDDKMGEIDPERWYNEGHYNGLKDTMEVISLLHDDFTREFYRENPGELTAYANALLRDL